MYVRHTEVIEKIPCVTGRGNPTFDQQQYQLCDDQDRTIAHVWIIRDRKTRPYWNAIADRYFHGGLGSDAVIAERVTLAEAQAIIIDRFQAIMARMTDERKEDAA